MYDSTLDEEEWDFSYLQNPETLAASNFDLKQAAAFYEYSRNCELLKQWVLHVKERQVSSIGMGKHPEVALRLMKENATFPQLRVLFLADCPLFPEKPFKSVLQFLRTSDFAQAGFARKGVVEVSKYMLQLFEKAATHGSNGNLARTTCHIFTISWDGKTSARLGEEFAEWASKNRPPECPEPKQGRHDMRGGTSAMDSLKQLAAWRFDKAGVTRDRAEKVFGFPKTLRSNGEPDANYGSQKKWNKAVREAGARVLDHYRPLVDHPQWGGPGMTAD